MPKQLQDRLAHFHKPEDISKAGIEYTVDQCRDLLNHGIPYLHFYTLSQSDTTVKVLVELT